MFACTPCLCLFTSLESGIKHIEQDPAHWDHHSHYSSPDDVRKYARSAITYLIEPSAAAVEAAKSADAKNVRLSITTVYHEKESLRNTVRPGPTPAAPQRIATAEAVNFRVHIANPTEYSADRTSTFAGCGVHFVYTYAPGDMSSTHSLQRALAAAYDGPELIWAEMCADGWNVTGLAIGRDQLSIGIRCEADMKDLMRHVERRGSGWTRDMEIGMSMGKM